MDMRPEQDIFKDFSSPAVSQVKDLHYESYLRTLKQVQEKRAAILKKLDYPYNTDLKPALSPSDDEISFETGDSFRYFTPIEKEEITHINVHVIRPIPRRVSVVRPVQYPGRKICHPAPQVLRRPRGSNQDLSTDASRLPPKKRPYVSMLEEEGPPSKSVKVGDIDHHESSGFCTFLPAHVINEYLENIRPRDDEMTAEDREVAEIMHEASSENKIFPFTRGFWIKEITPDKADNEVANLVEAKQKLSVGYCHSPREPWLPEIVDGTTAETDRRDVILNSFVEQVSPIIISLSPSPESSTTSLETSTDIVDTVDENSQTGRSYFDDDDEGSDILTTEDEDITDDEAVPDYSEIINESFNSEPEAADRPKRSMEEVRRIVLSNDRAAARNNEDKFTQTEAEQFLEILEDFLEENQDLAPHINDIIIDMLMRMRAKVATQKENVGILYTAELFMGESDDDLISAEFERTGDEMIYEDGATAFCASDSANFSRYDGYTDSVTNKFLADEEDADQNITYEIDDNNVIILD